MNTYKKWNIALGAITTFTATVIWFFWDNFCMSINCSYVLTEGTLRPLLWSATSLSLVLLSLLALPSKVFKDWLLHVASWTLPVAFFFIIDIDPHSGGFLPFDRGNVSWLLGSIIFLITIIYTIGWHLYEWRKGRIAGDAFARLSVFLISGAIFYTIWQLF